MPSKHTRPVLADALQWLVIALPAVWLLAAAALVAVEPYDGYDAICNARHFLGQTPHYVDNRAPFMSFLLMPSVLVTDALGLAPLDVRAFHLVSALLHCMLLVGTVLFLRRLVPDRATRIVCFVGSVLTVVFFSYGPFISHDLWPGLLLVGMLVLAERVRVLALVSADEKADELPSRSLSPCHCLSDPRTVLCSVGLVLLGAAAALVKQTFGVFWVCVLIAAAAQAVRSQAGMRRAAVRVLVHLAVCACISAVLYWLVMGLVLRANTPALPWFARPWRQLVAVSAQYAGGDVRFPWWIYVRNFPFYGLTTTVFIVPGLVGALRVSRASAPAGSAGSDTRRAMHAPDRFAVDLRASVAWAWLCGFAALHAVGFREVRYIAFLMPLSAVLVAGPLGRCLRDSRGRWLVFVLLACDIGLAGREAFRLVKPFYRENPAAAFLSVLRTESGSLRRPVFVHKSLNFLSPAPALFAGDRYHRLFHIGVHHVHILFRYPMGEVFKVDRREQLLGLAGEYPESVLLYANRNLVNSDSLIPGPPAGLESFTQIAGLAEAVWASETDTDELSVEWEAAPGLPALRLLLHADTLTTTLRHYAFPCVVADAPGGAIVAPLQLGGDNRAAALLPEEAIDRTRPPRIRVAAYRILRNYHPDTTP